MSDFMAALNAEIEDIYRVQVELMVAKPLWWSDEAADWPGDDAFLEEARIGKKHGPWLHQSMPEHLWPDNEWWWLPHEPVDDDDDW
jgi:hypothetical protein